MAAAEAKGSRARRREREMLRQRLEAEKGALRVCMGLLGTVTEPELRLAAEYLQPRHYADVVTERAVAGLCGFPLCRSQRARLAGKYRIDTRNQRVVDITELKDFCSKACFAASKYFAQQLSDVPVAARSPSNRAEYARPIDILNPSEAVAPSSIGSFLPAPALSGIEAMLDPPAGVFPAAVGGSQPPSLPIKERTPGRVPVPPRVDTGHMLIEGYDPSKPFEEAFVAADRAKVRRLTGSQQAQQQQQQQQQANTTGGGTVPTAASGSVPASGLVAAGQPDWEAMQLALDEEVSSGRLEEDPALRKCIVQAQRSQARTRITSEVFEATEQHQHQHQRQRPDPAAQGSGRGKRRQPGAADPGDVISTVAATLEDWTTAATRRLLGASQDAQPNGAAPAALPVVDNSTGPELPLVTNTVFIQRQLRRDLVLKRLNRFIPGMLAGVGVRSVVVQADLRRLLDTLELHQDTVTLQSAQWVLVAVAMLAALATVNEVLDAALRKPVAEGTTGLELLVKRAGMSPVEFARAAAPLLPPTDAR